MQSDKELTRRHLQPNTSRAMASTHSRCHCCITAENMRQEMWRWDHICFSDKTNPILTQLMSS